jgi:hypothetical protein
LPISAIKIIKEKMKMGWPVTKVGERAKILLLSKIAFKDQYRRGNRHKEVTRTIRDVHVVQGYYCVGWFTKDGEKAFCMRLIDSLVWIEIPASCAVHTAWILHMKVEHENEKTYIFDQKQHIEKIADKFEQWILARDNDKFTGLDMEFCAGILRQLRK